MYDKYCGCSNIPANKVHAAALSIDYRMLAVLRVSRACFRQYVYNKLSLDKKSKTYRLLDSYEVLCAPASSMFCLESAAGHDDAGSTVIIE